MAISSPFVSTSRKEKSLSALALFRISELTDRQLVRELIEIGGKVCASTKTPHRFQRKNARSLIRKVKILLSLFEFLRESPTADGLSSSARLCLREIHFLLETSSDLIASCGNSSGIWIALQRTRILTRFYDLNEDISAVLDVLPLGDFALTEDIEEQIKLLKKQCRELKLYVDPEPKSLLRRIFAFVNGFEKGISPHPCEISEIFVGGFRIADAAAFRCEIEFLEEQICNVEEEVDRSLLHSVIAISRYAGFRLFGVDHAIHEIPEVNQPSPSTTTLPSDFCCPISLELMMDPVVVATGQTYDRSSIVRWIREGHYSFPYSGQPLKDLDLVPNRALRNLIMPWCTANNISYDSLEEPDRPTRFSTRATVEADRASAKLLVEILAQGGDSAKRAAAMELSILARDGNKNRASIAEAAAIPLLHRLLSSSNPLAQENSMKAIHSLCILEKNKSLIVEQDGCLKSIVAVMMNGKTVEARENAVATLSSLTGMVHMEGTTEEAIDEAMEEAIDQAMDEAVEEADVRRRLICEEEGAMEGLAILLRTANRRAKKESAKVMYQLCTVTKCWKRIVESGAAAAMIGALEDEEVKEEAVVVLESLTRQAEAAAEVARMEGAVEGLVRLVRWGTVWGMECAASTLVAMCKVREDVAEKVKGMPGMWELMLRLHMTMRMKGMPYAALSLGLI